MSEQTFLIISTILHLIYLGVLIYLLILSLPLIFGFGGLLLSLFRPKREFVSPVPDDCPPEGTLHFIDITEHERELALTHECTPPPETHKVFQFTSNWGETDENVVALGMEILQQLCHQQTVLTVITSRTYGTPSKKRKYNPPPAPFIQRYHRYLQSVYPTMSTYADEKDGARLCLLSTGFHAASYYAFEEFCHDASWWFDHYIFTSSAPTDAQTAYRVVKADQYDILLELKKWPHSLDVTFNPRTVDIAPIQSVVGDICKKHDVILQNPPN